MINVKRLYYYELENGNEYIASDKFDDMVLCLYELAEENKKKIYNFCVNNYYNDGIDIKIDTAISLREARNIFGNRYELSDKRNEIFDSIAVNDKANSRKEGHLNLIGKVVIPCMYEFVDEFINGVTRAKLDGKWYYIDKNNHIVSSSEKRISFEDLIKFSESFNNPCIHKTKYQERINALSYLTSKEYRTDVGIVAFNLRRNRIELVKDIRKRIVIRDGSNTVYLETDEEKNSLVKMLKNI